MYGARQSTKGGKRERACQVQESIGCVKCRSIAHIDRKFISEMRSLSRNAALFGSKRKLWRHSLQPCTRRPRFAKVSENSDCAMPRFGELAFRGLIFILCHSNQIAKGRSSNQSFGHDLLQIYFHVQSGQ